MVESVVENPISYRPELPDAGVYLQWPESGNHWIHPDDITIAETSIPSHQVWLRKHWDGSYYHLSYGATELRVKPTLWLPVPIPDLHIEQQVELLSLNGKNDPGIFRILDVLFDQESNAIFYRLSRDGHPIPGDHPRSDLHPLEIKVELRETEFDLEIPVPDTVIDLKIQDED